MDCSQAGPQLRASLAGLLDDAEEKALRGHLAHCQACAAALPFAPPAEAQQRMAARLELLLAQPRPPRRAPDRLAAMLAVAAALLLLCVLWLPATPEPALRAPVRDQGWVPPLAASRQTPAIRSLPETILLAARRGRAEQP